LTGTGKQGSAQLLRAAESRVFALRRQFGGCIEVNSDVGKGTAFTLCFPLVEGVHDAATVAPA
jgi:hypothetical protein